MAPAGITTRLEAFGVVHYELPKIRNALYRTPTSTAPPALDALVCLAHRTSGTTASSSPPQNPIVEALQSQLQRLQGVVDGSYHELLSWVAQIGRHLPPTGADAANGPPSSPAAQDLAKLERQCDAVSADLLTLDGFVRYNVAALAQAAMRHDAATAAAADLAANGTAAHAKPVSPVFSHSDSAAVHHGQRYTASLPQDLYHHAAYRIMAVQYVGPGGSSDAVLWGLSLLYARLHHRQKALNAASTDGQGKAAGDWRTTDTFRRKNTKYWVHPSNVLRLKLACARHLPVLVYGQASPLEAGDTDPQSLLRDGAAVTGLISSVYFDNPGLHCYHMRLRKENEARLVRVRWYGQVDIGATGAAVQVAGAGLNKHLKAMASRAGVDGQRASLERQGSVPLRQAVNKREVNLFVERKTHYESWTGLSSVKERAPLPLSQLGSLITGSLSRAKLEASTTGKDGKGSKGARQAQLLSQVQHFLASLRQAPVLRTEYLRTAFQEYDANDVRISLDMDMLVIREQQLHQDGSLRGRSGALAGGDVVRFPYAVLEVKLQVQETPQWIKDLRASDMLVDAKDFSKFLHGGALLYPEAVQASPPWFVPDERTGTMTPATIQEMAERMGMDKEEQATAPRLFTDAHKPPKCPPSPSAGAARHPSSAHSSSDAYQRGQQPRGNSSIGNSRGSSRGGSGSSHGRRMAWLRDKLPCHNSGSGNVSSGTITAGSSDELLQASGAAQHPLPQHSQTSGGQHSGAQGLVALGSNNTGSRQLSGQPADVASSGDAHINIQDAGDYSSASPFSAQAQHAAASAGTSRLGAPAICQEGAADDSAKEITAASDVESGLAASATAAAGAPTPASAAAVAAPPAETRGTAAPPASGKASVSKHVPKRLMRAFLGRKKLAAKTRMSSRESGSLNEHMTGMKGSGPRAGALVRTRIEPKTFFANERTYLSWMQIAVLIMLTGLGLLASATVNGSGECAGACNASKIAGGIITPVSVLFMAYSLYMYKFRSCQIARRETVRYDDQRGPIGLTLLLIAVVVVSLVLTLISVDAGGAGVSTPIVGR